jgi:hypothetical protein
VRICKLQLVAGDNKRTLEVLALPIRACGAVYLEREALIRFVDNVRAEMSEAANDGRLVSSAVPVARLLDANLGRCCDENDRIPTVGVEYQHAVCICTIYI